MRRPAEEGAVEHAVLRPSALPVLRGAAVRRPSALPIMGRPVRAAVERAAMVAGALVPAGGETAEVAVAEGPRAPEGAVAGRPVERAGTSARREGEREAERRVGGGGGRRGPERRRWRPCDNGVRLVSRTYRSGWAGIVSGLNAKG
jgi:hypothetical protein